MSAARCRTPLDVATLAAWWAGDLAGGEADRVEEHLIACASCTVEAERFAALAESIRRLAREGGVRAVVGASWLERVDHDGLHVREYRMGPGGSVACTVTPEDDFVIARLAADLREAGSVDLSWCDADGQEVERLHDLPVGPDTTEILWVQETDQLRALGVATSIARLIARSPDGDERTIAEYTFHHTPTRRT